MDIASLGFKIDSSQAVKAVKDLEKLRVEAQKAEEAVEKLDKQLAGLHTVPEPVSGSMRKVVESASSDTGEVGGSMGRAASRGGASKAGEAVKAFQGALEFGKALKETEDPLMTFVEYGLKVAEVAIAGGGSLRAWAAALGLTNPYVAVAVAVVTALVGAFALFHREATKDYSDLPKQLGLTAKEVENLKAKGIDTSVTMGDTFKALFKVLGEDTKAWSDAMLTSMGTSWTEIGAIASKVLDGMTKTLAFVFAFFRAGWESQIQGFSYLFRNLIPIISDTFISAFNIAAKAVADFFNDQIDKMNVFIAISNKLFHTDFDPIGHVDAMEIANPFKDMGETAFKLFTAPFGRIEQYMDEVFGYVHKAGEYAVSDRINQIQSNRDSGDPSAAMGVGAGTARRAANDNGAAIAKLKLVTPTNEGPIETVTFKAQEDLELIKDTFVQLPKLIHPVRDQIALIGQDLSKSLGQAIANGENLGDALSGAFKRIAAEWASKGIQKISIR